MHRVGRLAIAASAVAVALVAPISGRADAGPLHIHDLRASVTRPAAHGARSVRVRAYVCLRSASEATRVAPDELRLTQYLIYQRRWRPTRSTIEYDNWVVSLGENWGGKPCGWVGFGDDFKWPEGFAGFDSPINCIGVAFSIKVGARTATKRVPIRCPNA